MKNLREETGSKACLVKKNSNEPDEMDRRYGKNERRNIVGETKSQIMRKTMLRWQNCPRRDVRKTELEPA